MYTAAANRRALFLHFKALYSYSISFPSSNASQVLKYFFWGKKKTKQNTRSLVTIGGIVIFSASNSPYPIIALLLFAQRFATGRKSNDSHSYCNCRVLLRHATAPQGNYNLLFLFQTWQVSWAQSKWSMEELNFGGCYICLGFFSFLRGLPTLRWPPRLTWSPRALCKVSARTH